MYDVHLDKGCAFNLVPHYVLIKLILNQKIGMSLTNWISSFLTYRAQITAVEGSVLPPVEGTSRVPQGRVLGSTLFLL